MFKISSTETESTISLAVDVTRCISDLKFDVTVGKKNSKQITSNIDSNISKRLSEKYELISDKSKLSVYAENERIGEVDLSFNDTQNGTVAYIEIEKSNKKTLWFDFVKLISKVEGHPNRVGIVICPKNYAHRLGTWNLYHEAVLYHKHLARLSNNDNLNQIAVIGYLQFAYLDGGWKEFSPEVIKRLKDS